MSTKSYLMGIDVGSTNIKSAIFDLNGNEIAVVAKRLLPSQPFPGWVERDMDTMWEYTVEVVRGSIKQSKVDPSKIQGVAVSGQGDGLYFIDKEGRPVRKGILSIDFRATSILKEWEAQGKCDELYPIMLQKPHTGAPVTLLAWLKRNEPGNYNKIRWVIFCKDYINYKLTGVVSTDESDATATLTDPRTRRYEPKILEILDIEECKEKLPPIIPSWELCGRVTKQAAELTGLKEGTPVASGLHDVDATGLGSGCMDHGQLLIILGTWEINQIVLDRVVVDPKRICMTRVHGVPGRWFLLNASPAAATNLNWFIDQLGYEEKLKAEGEGVSAHAYADRVVEGIPVGSEGVIYHPFLYGQTGNAYARAGFYGITGRHTRHHLLRAVYEGVAYSTYLQVRQLEEVVKIKEVRIAGGGAKSKIWTKILSDVMDKPIKVPEGSELGAKGVALTAGICAGIFKDHRSALEAFTSVAYEQVPSEEDAKKYGKLYQLFEKTIKYSEPMWEEFGRS